jgi:hypothetical protein
LDKNQTGARPFIVTTHRGQYFARVRFKGKLYRRKLDTDDLPLAKRKLRKLKDDLERTDSFSKVQLEI